MAEQARIGNSARIIIGVWRRKIDSVKDFQMAGIPWKELYLD